MPTNVVKTKKDERLWKIAKNYVGKKTSSRDSNYWKRVMGAYMRMKRRGDSK
jgi:hypothetical protein